MKKSVLLLLFFFLLFQLHAQWSQQAKAVASDRAGGDFFGYAVAIDGGHAIAGAIGEDSLGTRAGAAYVFEKDVNRQWNQAGKLLASDGKAKSFFGISVGISSDYAIVGASSITSSNVQRIDTGAAYIFEKDRNGNWLEIQKLVAFDQTAFNEFGNAVAICGNYAIVGAHHEGNVTLASSGAAYIFERDTNGQWSEVQKIVASDRNAGDLFGESVAIDKDYIIVGARGEDLDLSPVKDLYGAAYIFKRDASGTWQEMRKIVASTREYRGGFGRSVDIDGDYVVVGTLRERATGIPNPYSLNAVYFFEKNTNEDWTEVQKITTSDSTSCRNFGVTVSISGTRAVIGAPSDGVFSGRNSRLNLGAAYVFERVANGQWNQTQKIVASDRGINDIFGFSAAISGDNIIAGAFYEDHNAAGIDSLTDAGSAYLFEFGPNTAILSNKFAALKIYPNPSKGKLHIDLGQKYPSVKLRVRNILGEIISKQDFLQVDQIHFEVKGPAGFYLVEIQLAEFEFAQFKITKE